MTQPSKYPLHVHSSLIPWSREDVWQGIANTRERRKYQNRINQRARRSRRRTEAKPSIEAHNQANVTQTDSSLILRHIQATWVPCIEIEKIWEIIKTHDPKSWETDPLVRAFKDFIYTNWLVKAPRPALLPSLVQFNFVRALMANAGVLGLTSNQFEDDAISHFYAAGPWPSSVNLKDDTLPSGLQPTDLQRRTFHHPWFDLLPMPRMRDNLFRSGIECIDQDELCCAMGGFGDKRDAGLLVWGVSWDARSWEVTEDFARSPWAWIFEGCWELCESTNKWRAQRGEPPLFYSPSQKSNAKPEDKNA
ncbi:hypothetical protein F5Y09DRAFT_326212 [Xylaria sp. FL1042]|nr:hypothetical protein F5Y09DRAFT_326212 [Xylaria sp. FL1042]